MQALLRLVPASVLLSLFDVFQMGFSLLLAIGLALIISQVYRYTHRGMNYELAFMSTLVLLAPIVTLVMLFIRGDLVLSLGLIGSLSIIRFRTPIKDTRDMVFLFWTIAVGLGSGTYNWTIVILSSFVMVPVVIILYRFRYGTSRHRDYVLVLAGEGRYPDQEIETVINEFSEDSKVRSHEIAEHGWETVLELSLLRKESAAVSTLVARLNALESVQKTSLLAPQLNLPV